MNTNFNEVELAAAIRALDRANERFDKSLTALEKEITRIQWEAEDILAKYPDYDAARQAEVPR